MQCDGLKKTFKILSQKKINDTSLVIWKSLYSLNDLVKKDPLFTVTMGQKKKWSRVVYIYKRNKGVWGGPLGGTVEKKLGKEERSSLIYHQ